MSTVKEKIEESGYEDVCVFEQPSYESAFIGVSTEGRAVYLYSKMIESLMNEDGMTEEEAIEWIDYNTIRSLPYMYSKAPIIVMDI